MIWEALTAIGTIFTGLVILVTVLFARRQVEMMRHQLDQLRRTTQLEGATAVFAEMDSPWQIEARHFVRDDLPRLMTDPKFHDEVALIGAMDEAVHKELVVLRFFEKVGVYVSQGLIDGEVIYNVMPGRIVNAWDSLNDVVTIHRSVRGQAIWQNFERLHANTRSFQQAQGLIRPPRDRVEGH